MTPDELVKATDGVELKISELNQKIIDKIVENLLLRFEKTGQVVFSPSDEYFIKTLRRTGVMQTDILTEIQKATPGIQKEVKKAFKYAATNIGKVKVNKHVQETLNTSIPEGANETATTSEKIIDGRINEKDLSARQKKLLEDVYSRTKNEINKIYDGVARSGSNAFQDACNEAARMVRGGMGPQKAVREAIKKVAQNGTYIVYPSGHKDTIEVAVLRAVRTGVNQANAKLVLDLAEATGQDLVLVSSHEDARPAHQEWQGKIYSLSGKSRKYPEFRSATGFGTVQGLCGANCRHTFTIYYPGFSHNPYKRNNRQSNKKKYDYTQEQRKRERDIRKQKRIIDALEKAKAETNDLELKRELQAEIDAQKAKLREKKRAYNDFCEKHGLKKQAIRTYTYKSGPVENKSVWEKKETDIKANGRATAYQHQRTGKAAHSVNTGAKVKYNENRTYRIDLESYGKSINDNLSAAAKELAKLGDKDSFEHGVFVDLETGEIGKYVTDKLPTSVWPDYKYLKGHKNVAFLHNHNKDTELSLPDVSLMANDKEINMVAAVRNDGIITVVESNGLKTRDYLPLRYEAYKKELEKQFIDKFGFVEVENIEIALRDKAIEEFAKNGMRTYGE